jgi:hypothetical protein
MSVESQPTALLIGEPNSAAQMRAEDAVLFDQIRDRHHEESKRGDIHDRGSLHHRLRSRVRGLG